MSVQTPGSSNEDVFSQLSVTADSMVDSGSEYLDWDSSSDNIEPIANEYMQVCRLIETMKYMVWLSSSVS